VCATPQLTWLAILQDRTPSVRARRRDVPIALEAVVTKCLAKERDGRYPSVTELSAALQPFGER
jgi:serine/threonine-protein kinase